MHEKTPGTKIAKAISLIQEARTLALMGEYGQDSVEYQDVKERFDEAVELLESLL